jgi:hypothetical protein
MLPTPCEHPPLGKYRSTIPLMPITAQDFIAKWRRAGLSERSAVQQHFLKKKVTLTKLYNQRPTSLDVDDSQWLRRRLIQRINR